MREIVIDMNSSLSTVYNDTIIRQGENRATELKIKLSEDYIGYTYALLFQLNEENPVLSEVLTSQDDVLTYTISNAITSSAGKLKMELQASDTSGTLVKSAVWHLKVDASLDGTQPTIMPEAYVPWYTQIMEVRDEYISDEIARNESEATRISNETVRVVNEAQRVLSEDTRLLSENDRVDSEATRIENEDSRVASESIRVSNEAERVTNEGVRTTNETTRVTAESGRVNAESARVTAEQGRVSALAAKADKTYVDAQLTDIKEFGKKSYSKLNTSRNPTLALSTIKTKKPIVTFIDDDGNRAVLSKLKPISERQGVPFVIALVGQSIENGLTVTSSEALELQETLKWEIASHSQTHLGFLDPAATPELIEYEAGYSAEYMRSKGLNIKSFVYPGGQYDDESRQIVSKYYNSAISTDTVINTFPRRLYNLGRFSYPQTEPNNTLAFYKAKVDEAVASNGWLIWMLHCGQEAFNAEQEQILEDLIVYIKSIDVDILTVQDALDQSGDIININNGQYFVSADGDNNIRDYQFEKSVNNVEKFNFDTPPSFFSNNKITEAMIVSTAAVTKSPSLTSGYLVVHKSHSNLRLNQVFYSNLSIFTRQSIDANTWTEWQRLFTGAERTVTADFGTIPSMGYASRDVSVNSLSGGHYMMITPSLTTGLPKGLMISYHVTGGWVMTITIFNPTPNPIVVGNQTFKGLHMKAY